MILFNKDSYDNEDVRAIRDLLQFNVLELLTFSSFKLLLLPCGYKQGYRDYKI